MITRLLRNLLLAVTLSTVLSSTAAAQVAEHRIDVDAEGRIAVSDLVGVALRHLGSRVVPEIGLGGRVDVTGIYGRLTLATITAALGGAGISAELNEEQSKTEVVITIDREAWIAGLDSAEDTLRRWIGAPAQYSVERVVGPDGSPVVGPAVVMVHGLDSRAENLRAAANVLAAQGYDVYLYSYPDDGRIERAAENLGQRTREIREKTGRTVSLLTTSMGGVIARIYLELDPTYNGEVTTFIACNPPFQGSWMANYHELWELAESTVDLVTQGLDGSPLHDGLGQASSQLLPNSVLMKRLRRAKRRAGVRYSILAGAAPVADPALLDAADALVNASRPADGSPWANLALDLTAELIETARQHGHAGDGAVALANQTLAGVNDRVVRADIHHLQALSPAKDGKINWMIEVLERLPDVR